LHSGAIVMRLISTPHEGTGRTTASTRIL